MKVEVLRENLDRGVSVVARAVASRPQLPVLSFVLLNVTSAGLELTATDLEISLVVKVGAKVIEEGAILLPAKVLAEVVSTLPAGRITLELDKQSLKIKAAGVDTEITGMGVEEFPEVPRFERNDFWLEGAVLKTKIGKVGMAAAREGMKPVYEGILWDMDKGKVSLAATDGYRLGMDELLVESDKTSKYVLPVKSVSELCRVMGAEKIEVEFNEEKQQVCFRGGEVEMVSRLIGGDFPDYQQIVPKNKNVTVQVSKGDLEAAVKRAGVFARTGANVVSFKVDKDGLEISASSSDTGRNVSRVEAEVEGDEMKIAFNSKYLLEYLAGVDSEKIIFESEGEMKPGVFKLKADSFVHIIMPIRKEG